MDCGLLSRHLGKIKDGNDYGLLLLNENVDERKQDILVDIVAVHGLGGHARKTWTDRKTKYFWLQDIAKRTYVGEKRARVFTFGYDATIVFGQSTGNISQYAEQLLDKLSSYRKDKELEARRPIIFICHSLGGIIVKKALLNASPNPDYRHLFESIFGIMFLGTPHQGSDIAVIGTNLSRAISIASRMKRSNLLKNLRTNSEALENISNDFRHYVSGEDRKVERIVSIFELRITPGYNDVIVTRNSAVLNLSGDIERQVPLNTNHIGLSKFPSKEDENYRTVFSHVEQMVEGAGTRHEATMLVEHELLSKRLHKVNYQAHYEEILGFRCDKTVNWLLENSTYTEWKNFRRSQVIWLNGAVGSGKSVTAATLIKDLQNECHAIISRGHRPLILYFFCDGKESAKAEIANVIEALLHQILVQRPSAGYEIKKSIHKAGGQFSPTLSSGIQILKQVLSSVPKAFLVIDALDECTVGKAELLGGLLKITEDFSHFRLLVTTRSHPGSELHPVFEKWSRRINQISLAEEYVRGDIDIFLVRQLALLGDIELLSYNLKETVKNTIREQARGIFLWASLAWEMFANSEEAWSEAGVICRHERLRELGKGGSNFKSANSVAGKKHEVSLYGFYEAILENVPIQYRDSTRQLFLLMVFAQTPLTFEELKIACAINTSHESLDSLKMTCMQETLKIYFVDFSNTASPTTKSETSELDLRTLATGPFLRYSALHWSTHVAHIQFRPEVWERFLRLAQSGTAIAYSLRLFWYTGGNGPFPSDCTPMDVLCYMGLDLLVEKAFSSKSPGGSRLPWATANASNSIGRTALHWAASNGHAPIVRILLKNRGNPNAEAQRKDKSTSTALDLAAEYGHVEVVILLMDCTTFHTERGRLLQLASVGGHTRVLELLTAAGVDVNETTSDRPALHSAAFQDHIESVRWLLKNGAEVNLKDRDHGTALQVAAYEGNLEIVKLLLDNKADPNVGSGVYGSPLHAAAFRDWKDVARVLIEHGADIDSTAGRYGTAVNTAQVNGHTTMVTFLRGLGATTAEISSTPQRRAADLDEQIMNSITQVENEVYTGRLSGTEKKSRKFIRGLFDAVEAGNKRRLEVELQVALGIFKMAVRVNQEGFLLLIVGVAMKILVQAVKRNFLSGITAMTSLYTSALTFVLDQKKPFLVEKLLSECVKDWYNLADDGKDDDVKHAAVAGIEVICAVVEAGNQQLIEIVSAVWMEALENLIGGKFGKTLLSGIEDYTIKWASAIEQQENDRATILRRMATEVLSAATSGRRKLVAKALSTLFSQALRAVLDKSDDSARRLSAEFHARVSQIPVSEISEEQLVRLWMLGLEYLLATERGGRHGRDCKESQEMVLKLSRTFLQAVEDSGRLAAVIQVTRDVSSEKTKDCDNDMSRSLLKKDMLSVIDAVVEVCHGTEMEKMLQSLKEIWVDAVNQ